MSSKLISCRGRNGKNLKSGFDFFVNIKYLTAGMDYHEALKIVQTGGLADVKEIEELRSGLAALHLLYGNNREPSTKAAIESFENEISRRSQLKGATALHERQMEQGKNLHGETMNELEQLKNSVNQLARARTVDIWILIVGAVAAIAGLAGIVIGLLSLKH